MRRSPIRVDRSRQRGQSLVELVLMAPVLLLVLLFAVDFGRVFLGWVTVNNMARIGANYASLNPKGFEDGDAGVQAQYRALMENDATGIDCTLPDPLPGPAFSGYQLGDEVSVQISCLFPLITPFLSSLIGDGSGNVPLSAAAIFNVRSGAVDDTPVNPPRITPVPGSPSPSGGPSPSASAPTGTIDPSATLPPVTVSFYGEPTAGQPDASGGGPPGSPNEAQIVGTVGTQVEFTNTTTGVAVTCTWEFGDGSTQNNCANTVTRTYTALGTYTVTLTVNGSAVSRTDYVVISCKVPDFHGDGIRKNGAARHWADAGFTGTVTTLAGSGNYPINFQSIVGGQVNPAGGCGASITVGP